jgi:hypothetical protein
MSEWLLDPAIHQFLPARSQADVPLQVAAAEGRYI